MFETFFNYTGVLRRHNEGPLAAERAAYLSHTGGSRHVLRRSSDSLCVAIELQRWPPDQCFKKSLPLTHYDLPNLLNPLRQTTIRMHTGLESFDYTDSCTVIVYYELNRCV
jgi:hypothetical protein